MYAIAVLLIATTTVSTSVAQNQQQSDSSRPKDFVPPVHFKPVPRTSGGRQANSTGTTQQRHQKPAVRLARYAGKNEAGSKQDEGQFLSTGNSGWQQRSSGIQDSVSEQRQSVLQRSTPRVDPSQFGGQQDQDNRSSGFAPPPSEDSSNPLRQSGSSLNSPRSHGGDDAGQRIETRTLGNTQSTGYRSYRENDRSIFQDEVVPAGQQSCDDLRSRLLDSPITSIKLNISPDRRRVMLAGDELNRQWTDEFGNELARGKFLRLVHGYAIIETSDGERSIPFQQLSENDMAIINSYWELPRRCRLGGGRYEGRYWICQTVTWKASALCHKPLYFEDIQLERYGHSAGPLRQPLRSTAHFFSRLAFLPYQGGIHPPNECVYALGYYRPGDCAPWLVDPIPISLRGAARQSLSALGTAVIYP